jgi:hypothetical protein
MGMPCEVNSILKLGESQYPTKLVPQQSHQVTKTGYRILPLDVPIQLADRHWLAHADVVITQITWAHQSTVITFYIDRLYPEPFSLKG